MLGLLGVPRVSHTCRAALGKDTSSPRCQLFRLILGRIMRDKHMRSLKWTKRLVAGFETHTCHASSARHDVLDCSRVYTNMRSSLRCSPMAMLPTYLGPHCSKLEQSSRHNSSMEDRTPAERHIVFEWPGSDNPVVYSSMATNDFDSHKRCIWRSPSYTLTFDAL